ncbi:MAG: hypothetical protein AAGD22_05130 [Verrucomicrobiota bacterium]
MPTTFLSYAGKLEELYENLEALASEAQQAPDIDRVVSWTWPRLKATAFYQENAALLERERGNGFWAWKPFIIKDTLDRFVAPGDFLIYYDCGRNRPTPWLEGGRPQSRHHLSSSVAPLLRACTECGGVFAGRTPTLQSEFTRRDCFHYMDCDKPRFHDALQFSATWVVLQNTPSTTKLVDEWLNFSVDPRIISDDPNTCGKKNLLGFVDHRHDQAILSLLLYKFRFPYPFDTMLSSKDINWTVQQLEYIYKNPRAFKVARAALNTLATLPPSWNPLWKYWTGPTELPRDPQPSSCMKSKISQPPNSLLFATLWTALKKKGHQV